MQVYFEGVKATVQKFNKSIYAAAVLAASACFFSACDGPAASNAPDNPAAIAASVNGTKIKMEEVEKAVKAQGQGQEAKLSPLELTQLRLQALESIIQQEVMYQKAEKEKTVPTDEEVSQEFNKRKQASGLSQEKFDEEMKKIGETEQSARESIKKGLAIQKLIEKVTSKIEPPKDSEIEAFYNGNKEAFVKKKGVKLAAIVVDPKDNGEGDDTKDEESARVKVNEIGKELGQGKDFAAVAREKSEDQSRVQGGDLGYFSEDELKRDFPQAAAFMDPRVQIGQMTVAPVQGRFFILKLQERSDKDETLTLETPGTRQRVIDLLLDARKQLLGASYAAIAMSEAKIENFLAKQVVDNPNNLSGARPVDPNANANTNANTNSNTAGDKSDKKDEKKAEANSNAKPAASNAAANAPAGDKANTNAAK